MWKNRPELYLNTTCDWFFQTGVLKLLLPTNAFVPSIKYISVGMFNMFSLVSFHIIVHTLYGGIGLIYLPVWISVGCSHHRLTLSTYFPESTDLTRCRFTVSGDHTILQRFMAFVSSALSFTYLSTRLLLKLLACQLYSQSRSVHIAYLEALGFT